MNNPEKYISIRNTLITKLIEEKVFWSYDLKVTKIVDISDDHLIALTLKYMDLQEINQLKEIFSMSKIKKSWIENLLPEGPYLYSLNRFLAWYIFDIKNPDIYLKRMHTHQLNKLAKT